ncbi:WXG100 family type VII secretion target [Paenibacillus alkalitolerans]|uniref:WXG100 family type VII secretion target n=1 Tax=Paenibacillus alkalitolerans TaxID=2799335 RepID=UPI0018F4D001|nr:WXG100 family type VII secretion target [Paenibacillus alkalitolerans]
MPTPAEIRSKATAVSTAAGDIRREAGKYLKEMNGSSDWWKGDAGNATRQSYAEIDADISKLSSKLDSLSTQLSGLAGEVQAADDERRRKAEEERRRQANKQRVP